MVGSVPRCAVEGSACYNAFQLVQAHHDHCHSADIPQAAADAFHHFVGVCSECHVLREAARAAPVQPWLTAPTRRLLRRHLRHCRRWRARLRRLLVLLDCGDTTACKLPRRREGIERISTAVRRGFHDFAQRVSDRLQFDARLFGSQPRRLLHRRPRPTSGRGSGGSVLVTPVLLVLFSVFVGAGAACWRVLTARLTVTLTSTPPFVRCCRSTSRTQLVLLARIIAAASPTAGPCRSPNIQPRNPGQCPRLSCSRL